MRFVCALAAGALVEAELFLQRQKKMLDEGRLQPYSIALPNLLAAIARAALKRG